MLTFANPWFALLLPLPWLVWRFVPPYAQSRRGVRVPFFAGVVALTGLQPRPGIVVSRRGLWRSAALAAFPREQVASLNGAAWLAFLDRTGGTVFGATALLALTYGGTGDRDLVVAQARRWLVHHRC